MTPPNIDHLMKSSTGEQQEIQSQDTGNGSKGMAGGMMKLKTISEAMWRRRWCSTAINIFSCSSSNTSTFYSTMLTIPTCSAVIESYSNCGEIRETSNKWIVHRCIWWGSFKPCWAREITERDGQETPRGLPIWCTCLIKMQYNWPSIISGLIHYSLAWLHTKAYTSFQQSVRVEVVSPLW